jgi:hypothetical protein
MLIEELENVMSKYLFIIKSADTNMAKSEKIFQKNCYLHKRE